MPSRFTKAEEVFEHLPPRLQACCLEVRGQSKQHIREQFQGLEPEEWAVLVEQGMIKVVGVQEVVQLTDFGFEVIDASISCRYKTEVREQLRLWRLARKIAPELYRQQ